MALSIYLQQHLAHTGGTPSPAARREKARALKPLPDLLGGVDVQRIGAQDLAWFAQGLLGVHLPSVPATFVAAKQAFSEPCSEGEVRTRAITPRTRGTLELGWAKEPAASAAAEWK